MSQLPELVKALLKPETYPEETDSVSLIQTQMSFVFLTDKFVYKVKKAVNLGYLDYTTLEKRRFFCEKEVELNIRLCPDSYLGIIAINKQNGRITIGGTGRVVEYAVKMKRLPQQQMMDNLLNEDKITHDMISRLAARIARFHRQAATNKEISAFGGLEIITQNTGENFSQCQPYIGKTISRRQYDTIKEYTHNFIENNEALFEKRVKQDRIKDLHGDLHAAHICFENGICIYDCIEFNDRFRYGDTASEVAFLAMDLDHYGRANLSRLLVNEYISQSGDDDIKELLNFYKCYRAYVRGKVANFKLDDPYINEEERAKAQDTARSYFDLAYAYIKKKPGLFITVGLVGSGKTTLANELAKNLGLTVLSSDITRKRLASLKPTEHRFERPEGGIYSAEFTQKTYQALFKEAEEVLKYGDSVIIDASFIKANHRKEAAGLAARTGADFYILECSLDEETTKKRLEQRLKGETTSDGRWEIYQSQRNTFEPPVDDRPRNYVIIDSSMPVNKAVEQVLACIRGQW